MNKGIVFSEKANEIYRSNRNIIFLLALLTTAIGVLADFFDAANLSFLSLAAQLLLASPLLLCTYHVYTRAIMGKQTGAGFVFSWLTNGKYIIHGIKANFLVVIKLILWLLLYFVIVIGSAFFGTLGAAIGIIGGLILVYFKALRYNGALYECAADPEYPVSAAFDDGVDKLNYCLDDYISLWLGMCLPFIVVFTILEAIFAAGGLGFAVSLLGNIILNFIIYPRFHITGILLYNGGNFSHVRDAVIEE